MGGSCHFLFRSKVWSGSEVDVNGQRRQVYVPTSVGALAHWSDKGILLFEGQRNAVEMAQEDLLNRLSNRVNFSRIDFDHDFLL